MGGQPAGAVSARRRRRPAVGLLPRHRTTTSPDHHRRRRARLSRPPPAASPSRHHRRPVSHVQLTPTTGRAPNGSGRIVVAMATTVVGLTMTVKLQGSAWWDWAASPPHGLALAVWTGVAL